MVEAKPEVMAVIQAGAYPVELVQACQAHGVEVGDLLGWAVRPDEVTLLLADCRKLRVAIRGRWALAEPVREAQPPDSARGKKARGRRA